MQSFIEYLQQLPTLTQIFLAGCVLAIGVLIYELIKITQAGRRYRIATLNEDYGATQDRATHQTLKVPAWLKFVPGLIFGKDHYNWTEIISMYAFLVLAILGFWALLSLVV